MLIICFSYPIWLSEHLYRLNFNAFYPNLITITKSKLSSHLLLHLNSLLHSILVIHSLHLLLRRIIFRVKLRTSIISSHCSLGLLHQNSHRHIGLHSDSGLAAVIAVVASAMASAPLLLPRDSRCVHLLLGLRHSYLSSCHPRLPPQLLASDLG